MSAPMTLVVLLVAGDPSGAGARAMQTAAASALGPNAVVILREAAAAPNDSDARALAESLHADAVAELVWVDPEHRSANVHLQRTGDAGAIDRTLQFSSADEATEKGRTIGFALASMLPEHSASSGTPAAPPPDFSPPAIAPSHALVAAETKTTIEEPRARPWLGAVDASAVAAAALGGEGGGIGGAVAGQWYFASHFALRAGAALRTSQAEAAEASGSFLGAAIGAAWRLNDPSRARPLGFGARVDLLATRASLTHRVQATHTEETEARWVPAADFLLEASWSFADGVALLGACGPEARLGKTDVFLQNKQATTLLPVSMLFEVGIRARF